MLLNRHQRRAPSVRLSALAAALALFGSNGVRAQTSDDIAVEPAVIDDSQTIVDALFAEPAEAETIPVDPMPIEKHALTP